MQSKEKKEMHPRALEMLFDMQTPKVPCTFCGTITKTDVHVDYRGGIAVFTKYVCPKCKNEFMEKDLYERTSQSTG
jgi:transposase-like protein